MSLFDSDFLAGIQEQVNDVASQTVQTAGEFIGNHVSDALIKTGPEPTGNLTAAQLAAGQTGGGQTQPRISTLMSGSVMGLSMPIVLALGVAAYFLVFKKR